MIEDAKLSLVMNEVLAKHGHHHSENIEPENASAYHGGPVHPIAQADPVAVQLVNTNPQPVVIRGTDNFTAEGTVVKPNTPQLIAGRNRYRRTVMLVNKGIKNVAISSSSSVTFNTTGSSFASAQLYPGDSISLDTTSEVWAMADPTSTDGERVNIYQMIDEGGAA